MDDSCDFVSTTDKCECTRCIFSWSNENFGVTIVSEKMPTPAVYKLFSFTKVWKVAVGGSSLIMVLMIVFGIFWGTCFGILPRQSAFVAACLSLSSTPLVAKFVESKGGDSSAKGNAPVND